MKKASKMFPFITRTWNPLGGECHHNCTYCWAKALAKRHLFKKYQGKPRIFEKILAEKFKPDDFVFVCDMCDLFGNWVPREMIQRILQRVAESSPTSFLLLTKNPARYVAHAIPNNAVMGATIETDLDDVREHLAPSREDRLKAMTVLSHGTKMVSIEPIMKFSPNFRIKLLAVNPSFVAVGYDNYNNGLPEPSLEETNQLITYLEEHGITVFRREL